MKAYKFKTGMCRPGRSLLYWAMGCVILMALANTGCFPEKHPTITDEIFPGASFRAISSNPVHLLDANHAAVFDGDTLYLFRFKTRGEIPQNQVLGLVLHDGGDRPETIIMYDRMKWESFNGGDTLNYSFLTIPVPSRQFKRLQIKIPVMDANGTYDTLRVTADKEHLTTPGVQRCETTASGRYRYLNQWVFRHHLKQGVFFEVQRETYLLFFKSTCWVIWRKPDAALNKFMLHFIDQDYRFDNYSFPMEPSAFESCMDNPGGFWIARINLERTFDSYRKIRVGEFTGQGNIWTQTVLVSRILENELLRYNDELE